ncbi:MAG: type II secretion system F family protein [Microthrixaceae bacterium]
MNGATIASLLLLLAGTALLLSHVPWCARRPLGHRLAPYVAGSGGRPRAVVRDRRDLADLLGRRVAKVLGVRDDLSSRLRRAGRAEEPGAFRLRELTRALVATGLGGAAVLALRPGGAAALVMVTTPPLLTVLADEHGLDAAGARRDRRLLLELPVVAEQLATLLAAGASLPTAIARVAERGRGVAAEELAEVTRRIRRGDGELESLREWADRSTLPAVGRLVGVLSLHRETVDLGRLVTGEARAVRAERHRRLVEDIERRAQLVWVPVTVATLVPGLILLAIPFVAALSQVTGG